MKLQFDNIALRPDEDETNLPLIVAQRYSIPVPEDLFITHKSIDARKKSDIVFRYRVAAEVPEIVAELLLKNAEISIFEEVQPVPPLRIKGEAHVSIVGTGPGGLFCALRLIEAGVHVELFERGKSIDERMHDIKLFEQEGVLNLESNVLFGEGGAGTYSDGKLTTRTHRPEIDWFFKRLVDFGAPSPILYESKPHLGTDRIRNIVKNIRNHIIASGSKVYFNTKIDDCIIHDNCITSVRAGGAEYNCSNLVLAMGHSSRDMYELLYAKGVELEKKGFAIGVRVEHPAALINDIQYGNSLYKKHLGAAEYRLAWNNSQTARGIYSFCMCPGGSVINSSSEKNRLCTNGMSFSHRNSQYSNSAIVVSIGKDDCGKTPLAGIEFQRRIEEAAYDGAGGGYYAPAQRITSFLENKIDSTLPAVSYKPGVTPTNVRKIFPDWLSGEIVSGIQYFNNKMKGFISTNGVIIAAETRTSSPVRIMRDESMQSVSVNGLYPVGEGAGYSGGIVSSAVDGIRAADAIINKILKLT